MQQREQVHYLRHLRDRFGVLARLEYYDEESLAEIVIRSGELFGC